jgi:formylglycine-generating enzyme required for sulfatase activity
VKDTKSADEAGAFLRSYPSGHFAERGKVLKAALITQVAAITPPKVTSPSPAKPVVGVYLSGRKPGDVFRDCADCPEMVVIPRGRFRMGDLSGDGRGNEKPVHRVSIDYVFAVGKYEVTQDEWVWVMGSNPSYVGVNSEKGGRKPVEEISWNDAQNFVRKLSLKTGKTYRLLSESEWEYVARSGSSTKYSFGNEIVFDDANFNNFFLSTQRVGSFRANEFGLHDMHGNVWEWVEDCWHDNYQGSTKDGSPWTIGGSCSKRVLRGGSWKVGPRDLRAAVRSRDVADIQDEYSGFRVARTLSH